MKASIRPEINEDDNADDHGGGGGAKVKLRDGRDVEYQRGMQAETDSRDHRAAPTSWLARLAPALPVLTVAECLSESSCRVTRSLLGTIQYTSTTSSKSCLERHTSTTTKT